MTYNLVKVLHRMNFWSFEDSIKVERLDSSKNASITVAIVCTSVVYTGISNPTITQNTN
jgi:hypothetical protein